jgi:hypothetical protein
MKKIIFCAVIVCVFTTMAKAQEHPCRKPWQYKSFEKEMVVTWDLGGRIDYNRDWFSPGQVVYFNLSDGYYVVENTDDPNGYVSLWMFRPNKLDKYDKLHRGILVGMESLEDEWTGETKYIATIAYKDGGEYKLVTRQVFLAIPQQGVIYFNW